MIGKYIVGTGISLILGHIFLDWWRSFKAGRHARIVEAPLPPLAISNWPSVSILVPAWNEASIVLQSLQTVKNVTYAEEVQIVVIAGGEDGTYEMIEREFLPQSEQLILLRQDEGGKNVALNQGLAVSTGEVIVVLDADSLVEPEWLEALIRPLCAGADVTCGNYLPMKRTWVSMVEEMEKMAVYLIDDYCILQGSGAIAIKREILLDMNGFPPYITTGVDWDLNTRLSRAGVAKSFVPDAVLSTQRPATLKQFWKNEIRWRRAHINSLLLHEPTFFKDWIGFLMAWRLYILFIAVGGALFFSMLFLIIGSFVLAQLSFVAMTLTLIWMAGRKAALVGKVAAYTADWRWLKLAWAPALLLWVTGVASWWALLTHNRRTIHFKGPREFQKEFSHE